MLLVVYLIKLSNSSHSPRVINRVYWAFSLLYSKKTSSETTPKAIDPPININQDNTPIMPAQPSFLMVKEWNMILKLIK